MGAGTDVSIQTADVILMGNRFGQLVPSFSLARAKVRNMKQNTFIAVGPVVLLLTGVLFQNFFMYTGMLVREISVLVVIINAVRLVKYRDKKSEAITPGLSLAIPRRGRGSRARARTDRGPAPGLRMNAGRTTGKPVPLPGPSSSPGT